MKVLKSEEIRNAILKAIDSNDMESASELVEHWDAQFPLDNEGRCFFYLTKLKVLLRLYEMTENLEEKLRIMTDAVETGNSLFAANKAEGFPMDSEVELMWWMLIDYHAELISLYCEDAYGSEDDEDEDGTHPHIMSEAIQNRLGKINYPIFKR